MTNGLEKLTYGKPMEPESKKRFLQALTGAKEPVGGLIGRRYEEPEFKQKPLYGVSKPKEEPKTTESREYTAGQVGAEELERRLQAKQIKSEYVKALSQVYTKPEEIKMLERMEVSQLDTAWNNYQEWEMQRQQQAITEFGEKLGLDSSMVEQMQRVYPEEELASKLQLAGMYMTLLKSKHTSATLIKQFQELLSPEVEEEEEPTMGERMGDIEQYYEMTGEEGAVPEEKMPLDISETFDPQVGTMIQDVIEAYQELGEYPSDLLDAIVSEYQMNPEDAKRRINQILQDRLGVTVDFGLGEESVTPTGSEVQPEKTTLLKRIFGIGG